MFFIVGTSEMDEKGLSSLEKLKMVKLKSEHADICNYYMNLQNKLKECKGVLINEIDECNRKIYECAVIEMEITKLLDYDLDLKLRLENDKNKDEKYFSCKEAQEK